MASRRGWRGENGTIYDGYDRRIVGYGDPPSDPVWQAANPSAGRFPMLAIKVDNQDPSDPDTPLVEV